MVCTIQSFRQLARKAIIGVVLESSHRAIAYHMCDVEERNHLGVDVR
jgi:hypothetical protein